MSEEQNSVPFSIQDGMVCMSADRFTVHDAKLEDADYSKLKVVPALTADQIRDIIREEISDFRAELLVEMVRQIGIAASSAASNPRRR